MSDTSQTAEFRGAVQELHRYLCDELAPMMVTDSILFLMEQPPQIVAPQIHAWVGEQYSRGDSKNSIADYIYHALKKLHILGEFRLIDEAALKEPLQNLAAELLGFCAAEERDKLRQQISRLGQSQAMLTSAPVENIYRAGGQRPMETAARSSAESGGGASSNDLIAQGLRRFSLLLDRLGRSGSETVGLSSQASPEVEQVRMQALVTAAVQARNETELQEHLRLLGGAGIDSRSDQVFRMLGRSLPAWNIPIVALGSVAEGQPLPNRSMEAMRKVVALAETPQEWARRFNELVQAAIEQFNEGSLSRAATMLDLAEKMVIGKERHMDVVVAIRRRAHDAIKEDQLRKYAEKPEERSVLLRFMNFFSAFTVEGLLRQLNEETKRERRWLLLLLLEAHGASARAAALQELELFLSGEKQEPHGYHQRNLVFLLRRIPPGEGGPSEKELEALAKLSKLNQPAILVREAIRTLGPFRTPNAERILLNRLREFEATALRQASPDAEGASNPVLELIDHLCSALAAQRTSNALSDVVRHGLREEPALGDAAARLDILGSQDLSPTKEVVERLVRTLRERLPKKIFGLVVQKRESLCHLIRALAGTPLPAVRKVLEEIVAAYPNQDLAEEAAKALEALPSGTQNAGPSAPGLTGDIDLFGLPNLFQTFSDSRVTGALMLFNESSRPIGTVRFREGKVRTCQYSHLKGEDGLYQLFEKPEARRFAFHAEPAPAADAAAEDLIEVVPMLLEAMRRHDELQQARALVPDGVRISTTGTKPKKLEEEEDLKITQAVWAKIVMGSTPEQCEAEIPADAYRIRRLLAHWVEGGALHLGVPAAPAAV